MTNRDVEVSALQKERKRRLSKKACLPVGRYKTTLFTTNGTILKEYVTVPDDLLMHTEKLTQWFDISYAYEKNVEDEGNKKNK